MLRKLNITLWSGLVVDAGDNTDVETPGDIAALLAALNDRNLKPDHLNRLHNAAFILTLGAVTGSPSFTLDSMSVSLDGGSNYRIVQRYAQTFTLAGIYQIPLTEPVLFGGANDAMLMRLDATVTQLSGSHKFAASSLALQGNLWTP